jgi:molybdenum cofactor biosynthesis enzyme MoaA
LQLCKNQKEHYNNHPEISERMKKNNPVIHMTTKWRRKITKAITGKKRTYEQRLRYRESKLGTKNPNYKSGLHKHKSRVLQINHKVISVEKIGKQMTYDLSVPETHWFFANKVLVHNCAFCSVQTIWGRKWRAMSANNVVDQIEYLYKKGVKHFRINDDNLTIDKKRIIAICDEIIKRKINIKWDTPSGVAMWALDEEVLTAMKKSGYYRITFGIESGSYDTLKYIGKNIDLDKARNIIATSHKLGLWTASFFIIGFPYETREDIQKTEDFIVNCGVNFPFVFIAQPYAGTKMYEDFKKIGCDVEALSNSTVSKYNTVNFKAEELNEFRKQIYIKFYKKKIWSYCNPITFYKEFLSKIRSLEDLKYTTKMMMAIVTNILY